jgi:hypothetical protein
LLVGAGNTGANVAATTVTALRVGVAAVAAVAGMLATPFGSSTALTVFNTAGNTLVPFFPHIDFPDNVSETVTTIAVATPILFFLWRGASFAFGLFTSSKALALAKTMYSKAPYIYCALVVAAMMTRLTQHSKSIAVLTARLHDCESRLEVTARGTSEYTLLLQTIADLKMEIKRMHLEHADIRRSYDEQNAALIAGNSRGLISHAHDDDFARLNTMPAGASRTALIQMLTDAYGVNIVNTVLNSSVAARSATPAPASIAPAPKRAASKVRAAPPAPERAESPAAPYGFKKDGITPRKSNAGRK